MKKIALELFEEWNNSLLKSPKSVALLYGENAVLLGTINGKFRKGREEIEGYFKLFLPLKPIGKIDKMTVIGDEYFFTSFGHYSFVLKSGEIIHARFTFVYKKDIKTGKYKIVHHHSSRIP